MTKCRSLSVFFLSMKPHMTSHAASSPVSRLARRLRPGQRREIGPAMLPTARTSSRLRHDGKVPGHTKRRRKTGMPAITTSSFWTTVTSCFTRTGPRSPNTLDHKVVWTYDSSTMNGNKGKGVDVMRFGGCQWPHE